MWSDETVIALSVLCVCANALTINAPLETHVWSILAAVWWAGKYTILVSHGLAAVAIVCSAINAAANGARAVPGELRALWMD